jgi:hypothetical protein
MNYELAQKLKDAGFDVKGVRKGYLLDKFDCLPFPFPITNEMKEQLEYVYVPTLEELIEACGDYFTDLYRTKSNDDSSKIVWISDYMDYTGRYIEGSTPKEAVANLYLAINKK